jgi:hypothetical protein
LIARSWPRKSTLSGNSSVVWNANDAGSQRRYKASGGKEGTDDIVAPFLAVLMMICIYAVNDGDK